MLVRFPPLGPLLRRSWGPLGPSWRPLGPSWSPLGPSWGLLGGLLGPLGAVLGASWAVLGCREAEKVETPKSLQNLRKSNEFCLLGPSWECSWRPLGASGGHLGRLGAILWHLGALLYHLGGLLALLGALWRASRAAPRRKTISDPTLPGPARECPGVLFVRGPPGAAPRARTRNTVNQLPEILARLWPVGPANCCTFAMKSQATASREGIALHPWSCCAICRFRVSHVEEFSSGDPI